MEAWTVSLVEVAWDAFEKQSAVMMELTALSCSWRRAT